MTTQASWDIRRGDIYIADLSPVVGSEQNGIRPVLVVQNDLGNRYSPTTIIAPITGHAKRSDMSSHVPLKARDCGLVRDSTILLEQLRTLDRSRLKRYVGRLPKEKMRSVDTALISSIGLGPQMQAAS